ncbi:hypothetical protein [Usitatibacter palustris]|uniref:Peptidase S1 domain-containing protein n=1 Tax=Usitatibacter palustris TaxID=2732487 RepID=A0A6M4HA32_9PROT|nr:hypothetical protein [Usitatibacter palustris]QJR16460.1 hypothetical protein DSM104440_03295 [Usitatibacter palustris]
MRKILALLASLVVSAAFAAPVPGELAVSDKAAPIATLRIAPANAVPRSLRFAPLPAAEVEKIRTSARTQLKRMRIGVARDVSQAEGAVPAAADLQWVAVPGGFAARISVTSPGAAAMRVALDVSGAPAGSELVFFGSTRPERLEGPVRVDAIGDRTSAWWSPVTEGETLTAEAFIPAGNDPAASGIAVRQAAHLVISPTENVTKALAKIGEAGSCNIDAKCVDNPSQAYINARNSVARMSFIVGSGAFLCTGTLLNDTDTSSQIPYFYSANHCFDAEEPPYRTQAQKQVIANTLTTFWFYESATCGSLTLSTSMVQVTGGSTILHADLNTDVLFVRLVNAPPAGAFFAGWDPALATPGIDILGIHHPRGDLKKVSQGSVIGYITPDLVPNPPANGFLRVRWTAGTTEGGSSGSGIFSFDSSLSQYLHRGGLLGGEASCTAQSSPDFYSRFDIAYGSIAPYLNPGATPAFTVTGLWYNPAEPGWGINLTQHASYKVLGAWYTYAPGGNPLWYWLADGLWTTPTTYTGPLYVLSGPPPTGPFNPALVGLRQVGSVTITFTNANSANWSYTVDGVSSAKTLTRFDF